MKRYLIVNADDFGLNREVNAGIVHAFKNGVVTSASLLVNREGFADALEKIKENPDLDIGLHLNIFRGKPIGKLNYLVRKDGNMAGNILFFLWKVIRNKKMARREIQQEFEEQIKKARGKGVKISHLDTEKHIHMFSFAFKIVVELAKKYDIKAVRFPFEEKWALRLPMLRQLPKLFFGKFFCRINKSKELLKSSGLKSPNRFYGVSLSGNYTEKNFLKFLTKINFGISELSCHPGLTISQTSYYMDKFRQKELDVLCSENVKKFLSEKEIILADFNIFQKLNEREK